MTRLLASMLGALALLFAGIFLLPHIWNSKTNGPDITDPAAFIGCYGTATNKIVLSQDRVSVAHQSTPVVRFFYLKSDAAINTVNNLQYDVGGHNLRIGKASSGFFYKFDDPERPSAILIPDDEGQVHNLSRVAC